MQWRKGGIRQPLTKRLETMTNSDELTTMQVAPETARDDFAPNADRPEHAGYDVPAPEGAVMAGGDLDEDKIREAEADAEYVAEMCGF